MIYFSSFGDYEGKDGVSVSARPPIGYAGPTANVLVPSRSMLYSYLRDNDRYKYQCRYLTQLEKVSRTKNFGKLMNFLDGKVLLTNSKDFKNSHRYYLYKFLKKKGYEVEEIC